MELGAVIFPGKLKDEDLRKMLPKFRRIFRRSLPKMSQELRSGGLQAQQLGIPVVYPPLFFTLQTYSKGWFPNEPSRSVVRILKSRSRTNCFKAYVFSHIFPSLWQEVPLGQAKVRNLKNTVCNPLVTAILQSALV